MISSFRVNHTLKMVDLKLVTREFYETLSNEVNKVKDEKIEFRRDPKFLVRPKMIQFVQDTEDELSQSMVQRSRAASAEKSRRDQG